MVAIAITLVVLPLVENARELCGQSASYFLEESGPDIRAAAISFVVISAFWRDHHALFASATGYTHRVLRINLVWIAGIMVVPVVTMLDVVSPDGDRVAIALYLGDLALVMIVARLGELALIHAGLVRHQRELSRAVIAENCVAPALMIAALVLALIVPSLGLWPALLLLSSKPLRALATPGAAVGRPVDSRR